MCEVFTSSPESQDQNAAMTGTAAVRLSITIPTKAEEERLKKVYVQVVNGEVATPMGTASRASTIESLSTIRIGESPERQSHKVLNTLPKIQIQTCHDQLLDIPLDTDQEQVVRQILHRFHIPNAVWLPSLEGNAYHISFSMDFDERYENLYEALQEFGIGDREGSAVSVVSCLAHRSYVQREDTEEQEDQPSSTE